MTCKDCVHYEVCKIVHSNGDDRVLENSPCKHFKNKANFVELPCKVGDTVYKIVKFCEKNTGRKEFYRPSIEFEEDCPYLDPQSWVDDCDRCKAVEDYDEGCYCTLNLKIFCDTCKSRLAIQKEKFAYGMMTQVFNTCMFDKNTSDEDILYLTKEEAEQKLKGQDTE